MIFLNSQASWTNDGQAGGGSMCLITERGFKLRTLRKHRDRSLLKLCDGWYQKNDYRFSSSGHNKKRLRFQSPLIFLVDRIYDIIENDKITIKPFIFITGE
jgi:hypothetical protein